jgi:hypothetical protein
VYLFLIKYKGNDEPKPQKEERFVWYRWVNIEDVKNLEDIKFDLSGIVGKNRTYFI